MKMQSESLCCLHTPANSDASTRMRVKDENVEPNLNECRHPGPLNANKMKRCGLMRGNLRGTPLVLTLAVLS